VIARAASVLVVEVADQHRIVRHGDVARSMLGRMPIGLDSLRPITGGATADLEMAAAFLRRVVRQAGRPPWELVRARAVMAVPIGAAALERQAFAEVGEMAGFGRVDLVPAPIAGAIGEGIDPMEDTVRVAADIGAATSQLVAYGCGGIIASHSIRVGGDAVVSALVQHLRAERRLAIGDLTGELALARASAGAEVAHVVGRDLYTDQVTAVEVPRDEVVAAVAPVVDRICRELATAVVGRLPPEAAADAEHDGVLAFGGLAQLDTVRCRLEEVTGLRVRLAVDPLTCVARGAAQLLMSTATRAAFARPA
jgi:rod shape-determining protein MreB